MDLVIWLSDINLQQNECDMEQSSPVLCCAVDTVVMFNNMFTSLKVFMI